MEGHLCHHNLTKRNLSVWARKPSLQFHLNVQQHLHMSQTFVLIYNSKKNSKMSGTMDGIHLISFTNTC